MWIFYREYTLPSLSDDLVSPDVTRAVVVPERSGTLFQQIVLSRSGAPVNVVGHRRNANTVAFWHIS